jgi:hypothetical protein
MLSDRAKQIVVFERQWWKYAGSKEQAIRSLFEMNATRYYQVLNEMLDDPEVEQYDPMTVHRLQRSRDTRLRARMTRTRS